MAASEPFRCMSSRTASGNPRRLCSSGIGPSADPGSHALYTYDALGRVTDIHHKDTSSGNTLARFEYGWDDASQVTHLDKTYYDDVNNTRITTDTSDLGDQYAYDGAKRLVTVLRGVPSAKITTAVATNITNNDYDDKVIYYFDQTGNRLTREVDGSNDETYEHNTVNEMTKVGTTTQNYTDAGNWSGTSNAFKYDWENHLAEATVGSDTYEWHYDALGRRVQLDDPNGDETRFYYDGIHAIEEVSWDGSTETQEKLFVYGEGVDELLEYVDISADPDDTTYAHSEMLGSVQVLADETGAIAESYRYREFGVTTVVDSSWNKLTTNVSAVGNPYRYTARRQDEVLSGGGLTDDWYYYRARAYRPEWGRFGQRDPLHHIDGANQYLYVNSSPAVKSDPSGKGQVTVPSQVGLVPGRSGSIGGAAGALPGAGGGVGSGEIIAGVGIYSYALCPPLLVTQSPDPLHGTQCIGNYNLNLTLPAQPYLALPSPNPITIAYLQLYVPPPGCNNCTANAVEVESFCGFDIDVAGLGECGYLRSRGATVTINCVCPQGLFVDTLTCNGCRQAAALSGATCIPGNDCQEFL